VSQPPDILPSHRHAGVILTEVKDTEDKRECRSSVLGKDEEGRRQLLAAAFNADIGAI
jgi:hypothetical protein